MAKDEEITEDIKIRRNNVALYRRKALSNNEIAKNLQVSLSTVEKDIAFIKDQSKGWLNDMAKFGIVDEWHMGIDKLKDNEFELQKMMLEKEPRYIGQTTEVEKDGKGKALMFSKYTGMSRLRILKALDDNICAQREYLLDGPAVHIMDNHLETGVIDYGT